MPQPIAFTLRKRLKRWYARNSRVTFFDAWAGKNIPSGPDNSGDIGRRGGPVGEDLVHLTAIQTHMAREHRADGGAEIGGDCEIAPVMERLGRQTRPRAIDL